MTKKHTRYLNYEENEVPDYSYCEATTAGSYSKWHIRPIKDKLFFGGGIDTDSLCGHVKSKLNGWDINVRILEINLPTACPECVKLYLELNNK
jgi:hypothetical protein